MITIQSAEHALAAAAGKVVETARFIQSKVLPTLRTVQANESTIEAVTGLVDPQAVNVERIGFAVLGLVIKAIDDAGSAANGNGLNVSLDAALVADIKSIVPSVKAQAALLTPAGK